MSPDDSQNDLVSLAEFKGEPILVVHPSLEDRFCPLDLLYAQ